MRTILFACLLSVCSLALAKGEYLSKQDFLAEAFGATAPEMKKLWLSADDREAAKDILNREFAALRVRYWTDGVKTAWILNEIGKTEPITVGVVIAAGEIAQVQIMEFRESRGWEVRFPFFTDQFTGARLESGQQLTSHIDGITGATLSVRAVKKVAALALHFHQQVEAQMTTAAAGMDSESGIIR